MPHPFLPSFCSICRRSASIGRGRGPYTYYCQECSEMPAPKPLDEHEKTALLAMDEAAGDYAAEHGTDLAAWTEAQRIELWKLVWLAAAASLKAQAAGNKAPF